MNTDREPKRDAADRDTGAAADSGSERDAADREPGATAASDAGPERYAVDRETDDVDSEPDATAEHRHDATAAGVATLELRSHCPFFMCCSSKWTRRDALGGVDAVRTARSVVQ